MTPTQKLLTSTPTAHSLFACERILRTYNDWRRGKPPFDEPGAELGINPDTIGTIIDRTAGIVHALAEFRSAIPFKQVEKAWGAKRKEDNK